ncbi:hypothetical protein NL108_007584, partial [Boleophthalmus pectinirostris]
LWAVVNNAGVTHPSAPTDWLTIEDYRGMLAVNLDGVISVTLSILPLIKKAKGRVVNVSSVFGRISPFGGPYSISKYGVEAFTDSLRVNMSPFGVTVCCLEPGFFRTNAANEDLMEASLTKLWNKLPQDVKDDYGHDFKDKALALMNKRLAQILDPDLMKVVSCMEHAISAVHPRKRYSPGYDTKMLWLPLSYMPSCLTDWWFSRNRIKLKISSSHLLLSSLTFLTITFLVLRFIRDSFKVDQLTQRHVLITGCDSGFGNLLARQLDAKGIPVIAACFTEKGAVDLSAVTSSRLKTVPLNVADSASIKKAVEFVSSEVGSRGEVGGDEGRRCLWGLVNNAGISIPAGPTEWMKLEDFTKILDVNLLGVIDVTLHFLPLLKKAKGRVVNVASIFGRLSLIGGGYCLSKYGVEAFSDSLRLDMHHFGIKVSIIEPGFFKTAVTSSEAIKSDVQRLWNRLPQEVKDSYGEDYMQR